ncbi:class I SAM-dependent methyltransferase [Undibacterium flavidum]|uniref:SAM-dependent methyltransferase n=1 Tax=Undibacterium flavidum TaxID=2762297 RepID=A0ABR6YH38_9BURK|nr:SAM-dependent methyltransferase [Undibacterium flavidum]MBC3875881.1 SAM-dependent methyltransferase [Undibacterium flavidum]
MQKLNSTPHQKLALPTPSADAMQASQQLQKLIRTEIANHGGVIPFSHYMEMALYTPRLGYYSGGSAKLGADGDFTTAPEMSSLFGATLAQVAQQLFTQTPAAILEFGAGTGKLAFDILSEYQDSNFPLNRYFIVELSGELRARQEQRLKDFPQVVWLSEMPAAFSGVVIGNEVLDAIPIELMMRTEHGWSRLGVAASDDPAESFKLISLHDQAEDIAHLIAQIPESESLPIGYISEVHPVEIGFMRSVAAMLLAGKAQSGLGGAALWLDYGFPAQEYYLPQRDKGTLMCHYRHHAHPDPFYLPGLQDITAHVDFTAIAIAGVEAGLDLLSYTSQASFLLSCGLTDVLKRIPVEDPQRYLPASNAVQKLTSPAEMGELFKVLLLGCDIELPISLAHNLARFDRSHKL